MPCATACGRWGSTWESPWRASRLPPQPPGRRKEHPLAGAAIGAGHAELERWEAQCVERAAGRRVRIDTAVPQQKIQDDEARVGGHDIGPAVVGDERRGFGERYEQVLDRFAVLIR